MNTNSRVLHMGLLTKIELVLQNATDIPYYTRLEAIPEGDGAGLDMLRCGQQHMRWGRLQSESASSAPPLLSPTPEASSPTGDAGRRVHLTRAGSAFALCCLPMEDLNGC